MPLPLSNELSVLPRLLPPLFNHSELHGMDSLPQSDSTQQKQKRKIDALHPANTTGVLDSANLRLNATGVLDPTNTIVMDSGNTTGVHDPAKATGAHDSANATGAFAVLRQTQYLLRLAKLVKQGQKPTFESV